MSLEPVRASLAVPLQVEAAFDLFCDLGRWWPLAYTFAGADFVTGAIEPDRWYERDARGVETSWGETRRFERPRRLVLAFGVSADRRPEPAERCSEVEVAFASGRWATDVELEHRAFEHHGNGAGVLRAGLASPQGWRLILAEYVRAARLRTRMPPL